MGAEWSIQQVCSKITRARLIVCSMFICSSKRLYLTNTLITNVTIWNTVRHLTLGKASTALHPNLQLRDALVRETHYVRMMTRQWIVLSRMNCDIEKYQFGLHYACAAFCASALQESCCEGSFASAPAPCSYMRHSLFALLHSYNRNRMNMHVVVMFILCGNTGKFPHRCQIS